MNGGSSGLSCSAGVTPALPQGRVAGNATPGVKSVPSNSHTLPHTLPAPAPSPNLEMSRHRHACPASMSSDLRFLSSWPSLFRPHPRSALPPCALPRKPSPTSIITPHQPPAQQRLPEVAVCQGARAMCVSVTYVAVPARGVVHGEHLVNICSVNPPTPPSFLYQHSLLNTSFWNTLLTSLLMPLALVSLALHWPVVLCQ